jgi:hypothetical protein
LAACGPIYLHDPAGETAAMAAMQHFQAVLERGRVGGLVAGYKAQQATTVETLQALREDDTRTQLVALSSESWDFLIDSTRAELDATDSEIGQREIEKISIEEQLQATLEQQPGLQKKTKDLLDAMNAAAAAEARYVATQKLLSAGLAALVGTAPDDPSTADTALKAILAENVPTRSFKQEGGELVEVTGEVTVGKSLGVDASVIDALGSLPRGPDDLFRLIEPGASLRNLTGLEVKDPGIAVTIVGLGYDVARAEERRLGTLIDSARRKLGLYADYLEFTSRHQTNLRRNLDRLEMFPGSAGVSTATTVRATIEQLAKPDEPSRDLLRNIYGRVGEGFLFRVVDAKLRDDFETTLDNLEVEEALALAEVNLREREAVIARGLEGLVAFNKGGIDADDVRNLIGVAQAIGIFVIAAQ